ncbi:MAG TPA: hypothetical protein VLA34_12635 [Candidatus Krumholzibacterium sp.]|nr:hypothetical protein [Candidatus Krumholzibacterium sp.]
MKKNIRTIDQYCSVCKEDFDMEVVEEAENNEVLWLKCPGCEGFLPYMVESDEDSTDFGEVSDEDGAEAAPEDFSIEDKENALEYDKTHEYKLDDIIYHRSWNDYGKVVAKETLPGHRKTILVNFGHQGKIRLLEGEFTGEG